MEHTEGKATIGHLGTIVNIANDGEKKESLALVRNAGSQFNEQARINAQRMVLTWNAYDPMLEMLQKLVDQLEKELGVSSRMDDLGEEAKKLINNAKS
jgi:hypothetical protein